MAVTTLSTWMKTWLNELVAATQDVGDSIYTDSLRRHRKIGFDRASAMLNSKDGKVTVDRITGQLTLTLVDIDGTKTNYRHAYQYYLFEGTTVVTVDDVVVASGFNYHTLSMDLVFGAARAEDNPVVKIKGHVLDLNAATLEIGEMLILRLSSLPTVRDHEFDKLANRFRAALNRQFKSKIIRRR